MTDKVKILVVEDDLSWQENYEEAFSAQGYAVKVAGNKSAALELLEREFFHVAVVDLKLGPEPTNREGRDVLQRIWELDETLAVVSSGYVDVSMFDEFRQMGIFGFTEKNLAEARREFNQIGFFKGQFTKSDDLNSIVGLVRRAAEEARSRNAGLRWSTSPFSALPGLPAREIQRELAGGPMMELRPFLQSLLQPLFPWLTAKQSLVRIQNERGQTLACEALCWSRHDGQAYVVRFGRQDGLASSLEHQPLGAGLGNLKEIQLQNQESCYAFTGLVGRVAAIDFKANFNRPPTKKTSRATNPAD